jgi:hypothetical protein
MLSVACRKAKPHASLVDSFFARGHQLRLTIARRVEPGLLLISFRRSGVVAEEADETHFWLELLVESDLVKAGKVESLITECVELVKIFSASLATAKANR